MPGKGQLGTITQSISYMSTAVTSVVGNASHFFFFTMKVFSLAGVSDEDVRVGSHTHEDIRVKANYSYMHEQHDRWWSDHC